MPVQHDEVNVSRRKSKKSKIILVTDDKPKPCLVDVNGNPIVSMSLDVTSPVRGTRSGHKRAKIIDSGGSPLRKPVEKKEIPGVQELGFASKTTFMCAFPQLQPKNPDGSFVTYWERQNGDTKLMLTGSTEFGLPASRDRLLAHWLKTKSVMLGDPMVPFKDGAQILEEMGLDPEGNNKKWLNAGIDRFTNTVMSYQEGNKFKGGKFKGSLIIQEMNGYFDESTWDRKKKSYFILGSVFFEVPGIPINLNDLRRLGRAWFAIDLFTFMNYRLWFETRNAEKGEDFSKRKPIRIPMREYRLQNGSATDRSDKHLRSDIKQACDRITAAKVFGTNFEPYLDDNDVITVPIVRPESVYSPKFREMVECARAAIDDATTRLMNTSV